MIAANDVERAIGRFITVTEHAVTLPLIVGVSGGPDSMALLHALKMHFPADRLLAAHLGHGLRPTSKAEAEFVARIAARWAIRCVVEHTDIAALARSEGLSLEAAGRLARYRFFARVATDAGASAVIVAHHADDQVETILMHLLRGSGLAGLQGMQPVSSLPDAEDIKLLRPLLSVGRGDIESYCRRHQLEPIMDRSNEDVTFFRNRVRHELLPQLERYNPQIRQRLLDLANVVSADYAYLDAQTAHHWAKVVAGRGDGWLLLEHSTWLNRPLSLRRSLLRRAVQMLMPSSAELSFRALDQARAVLESGGEGTQTTFPGGLTCTIEAGQMNFSLDPSTVPIHLPQLPDTGELILHVPGHVRLSGEWVIEAARLYATDLVVIESNPDPWSAYVDITDTSLLVRPRLPGERFQLLGLAGKSATVKDVMIDRKIPARLRARWPLVANAEHLVWLTGHHLDERVKVTSKSRQIVRLHCYSEVGDSLDGRVDSAPG